MIADRRQNVQDLFAEIVKEITFIDKRRKAITGTFLQQNVHSLNLKQSIEFAQFEHRVKIATIISAFPE